MEMSGGVPEVARAAYGEIEPLAAEIHQPAARGLSAGVSATQTLLDDALGMLNDVGSPEYPSFRTEHVVRWLNTRLQLLAQVAGNDVATTASIPEYRSYQRGVLSAMRAEAAPYDTAVVLLEKAWEAAFRDTPAIERTLWGLAPDATVDAFIDAVCRCAEGPDLGASL